MEKLKRYLNIFWIYFKTMLTRDLTFRFSFFTSFMGAFVFVFLNLLIVYFLTQKVVFGKWTQKEMWVLLGAFLVIYYSFFLFFWRGILKMIRSIRDGRFDFFLLKPIDLQFMVSNWGGGIHNFLAVMFGIYLMIIGMKELYLQFSLIKILLSIVSLIFSILAVYSWVLILACLNFRFGYLEEIFNFALSVQEISRYPFEAYSHLPVQMAILVIPFSALTTVPAMVLINAELPVRLIFGFWLGSGTFIWLSRRIFYRSVRTYTSCG
jgi:ABC-2 type transport system permease protein